MATAVSNLTPASTNQVDIKTFNETYRVYVKLDADGKKIIETKMGTAGKDNAFWTKMDSPEWEVTDKAGNVTKVKNPWVLGLEQTAKLYKAGTWSGAALLIEDEEERVNVFNRGGTQKVGQKLTTTFTELTDDESQLKFDPITGSYDTIDLLNAETQRRNLSPTDKAIKNLREVFKGLNPGIAEDDLESKVNAFFATLQQ